MKRILSILCLALFAVSCGKVGSKFDQSNSGSPGAATTGASSSSTGASTTSTGASTSADVTGGETVEKPSPTAAQLAALEGGQEIKWDQQGISWTVPKGWVEVTAEKATFNWRSSGGGDFQFLIGSISAMPESFPTDISLKATYDSAVTRKKNGELEDVRWLEIDGVKGVVTREAMPEGAEDPRRLQWMAYRKYAGQTQLVNLILSTKGRNFEKSLDTLYGILYSTKLVH